MARYTRLTKRLVKFSGFVLGLAAITPGCTTDVQSMLFIRQVQATVAPACAVDNSPDSAALTAGTLDTAFRTVYQANVLVGNQLVARGSPQLSRTETSNVQFRSASVRIENAEGTQLSAFTVPITGFVEASLAGTASYGVASVPLIDNAAATAANADAGPKRLFSYIKIKGETLGGSEVESAEFGFPITVCKGCLVSFPADADDPTIDGPDCKNTEGTGNTGDQACFPGQDGAVDCRSCASTMAICNP
jgi:hypothetical protein